MKKKRTIKNTLHDWLIDFIFEPIRGNLFEKKLSQPKTQKQSEKNIIKNIWKLYILKEENKKIKDRIIRDKRNLFQ